MLQALKSGDVKKISKYEDIYAVDIDAFINNELPKVQLNEKIKALQNDRNKSKNSLQNDIKEETILKLIELDVKSMTAKKAVETVLRDEKNISEINELVKKAFKIIVTEENNKVINKKIIETQMDKEDLRNIVMKGKKEFKTAYDTLKENGYIKEVNKNFLKVV